MSHLNPGLISAYNSLTDKHLAGYFSNTRIRRHLQRAGLITRSGRIVPDKEYRHKLIQRAHQRHVRECLAQAIFHKVLEMERLHQIEIKRKLEEFARRERVHKIKVERSRRYEEDIIRILSPRPPTGARGIRKQHSGPEGEHSESSESPGSSRPNTAPGKMQRPVRLKPIHSNSTTASLRHSSPYRLLESSNENDRSFNCTVDKESRRHFTTMEASRGISPYCLPVINNFVTPVPPATKRKERGVKVTPSSTLRGRRLRPTTASSGADVTEDPPMLRSSVHQSRVCVNMVFFGKTVHLSHDLTDMRDEIKVFQQHCGGENLCVYKGKLREGETFQFISRRHRGFPFSLTFFLNGLQVERLSSCCEFKHRKGSRLGGRHGHFGFSSVEGASPCYKCIIAMGLDKKPTPPPKRVREDGGREESVTIPMNAPEMETLRAREDAASHSDCETSPQQDMRTQVIEETAATEEKVRDDYEEDFEGDDEGPAEEAKEKESPSPASETETQVKERVASESEDEKDEDIKSRSGSSCSGSDREASDAEATKDSRDDEKAEQPEEAHQEETPALLEEKDEPNPEESAVTEAASAVAKDSDLQDSAGDSTEIDISDNSIPSGTENKQSDDTSGDREAERTVEEGKQEEDQEQERAKSVQEKLAEAILKESHCSSEPELSDTSTEEEEEAAGKGPEQNNNDVVPEQQQALTEETKCEGSVVEAEVVQDQEETSEPKEQEEETEKETHENGDSPKDETVKIDEEPAAEREAADKDDSEDTGAALHPVSEESTTEENKTSEPQEDAAANSTDAAETAEESHVKTAEEGEADTQPGETGQGAKSSEEDESSVSEPNKRTDETAESDNAEATAEATAEAVAASEAAGMKAEPSEEREALGCEEGPVADAEQGDGRDTTAAAETEVTAEDPGDAPEEGGEAAVGKTADVSEGNAKDEGSEGEVKEEEAEEASATEEGKDGSQQGRLGEEQADTPVEVDDEVGKEKSEESKEEEKQTIPDETPEGGNSEEKEKNETGETEEERNGESQTEERTEREENTVEDSKSEGQTNEEPAETIPDGEDKVASEERADESEKTEKEEDGECVENKDEAGEAEAQGAVTGETHEAEETNQTEADAGEEKGDEAEKEGKDDDENKAEQSESEQKKGDKESDQGDIVTCETGEGEEVSEITDEAEKNAEDATTSREHAVEPEDVGDGDAADGTETNNVTESEDVKRETEGASTDGDQGQIDAENGETSAEAESRAPEDEAEAPAEDEEDEKDEKDVAAAEPVGDEGKAEEEATESTETQEAAVEPGEDEVEQVAESEAQDGGGGGGGVEKQDEPAQKDSEQETAGSEMRQESKPGDLDTGREDGEETRPHENGDESDLADENRDSDSTKNNGDDVNAGTIASDQAESAAPLGSTAASDKQPRSDENAASAAAAAADGENGADTEEASKASEEGASVLLKPQAQNNEADGGGESAAVGGGTPEALAAEDGADLVTNWVNMHQTSKFFETFVEPLDNMRDESARGQASAAANEAAGSPERLRPEGPLTTAKAPGNEEEEQNVQGEAEEKRGAEAGGSDPGGEHAHENDPENDPESDPARDEPQEQTEVTPWTPRTEAEGNHGEPAAPDGPTQTHRDGSTVGSAAAPRSVQSETEDPPTGTTSDDAPRSTGEQAEAEETTGLLPSSAAEERGGRPASPGGERRAEGETPAKTDGQSPEVTEITDFSTSKSDDGSQEESRSAEVPARPSDGGVNGERGDAQLLRDVQRTLSRDRLSTFSVDETLFGRSPYPLLTAATTEGGH